MEHVVGELPSAKVYSTKWVRVFEENAVWLGVPLLLLMENAGKAVAAEVAKRLGGVDGKKVVVFAGRGGNAGDGAVAARHLAIMGADVKVVVFYPKETIEHPDTELNLRVLSAMHNSVRLVWVKEPSEVRPFDADALIDALIGVGIRGRVREPLRSAINIFNESRGLKVAVDVPSGIDPDTGLAAEPAVKADVTVTMHYLKPGLLKAKEYVGEVVVAEVGIPPEAETFVGPGDVKYMLPDKPPDAHKGVGGRVVVIGGGHVYAGAPALAAMSALRAGADLAFVIAPSSVADRIASFSPNLIVESVPGEWFEEEHVEMVLESVRRFRPHCVVVGPGLGVRDGSRAFTLELLKALAGDGSTKGLVVDADALKHIAGTRLDLHQRAVLTPHAGEAGALLGLDRPPKTVNERVPVAKELSRTFSAVVLLKGPVDVIAHDDRYRLNRTGNRGMSVGGTGDVLSGVLAAVIARGVELFEASCVAAYICGRAGDMAYEEFGERILATDLIDKIPLAIKEAKSGWRVKGWPAEGAGATSAHH